MLEAANQRSPERSQSGDDYATSKSINCFGREGWKLSPADVYLKQHAELISSDGLGSSTALANKRPFRIASPEATEIILIDMPLWIHFWLAAERQIAWASGKLEHTPGRISTIPPTDALFPNHMGGRADLDAGGESAVHQCRGERKRLSRASRAWKKLNAFTPSA